jgi:hypothetical protein
MIRLHDGTQLRDTRKGQYCRTQEALSAAESLVKKIDDFRDPAPLSVRPLGCHGVHADRVELDNAV